MSVLVRASFNYGGSSSLKQKYATHFVSSISLAGEEGFEPPNARARIWCLTAWRLPNSEDYFSKKTDYLQPLAFSESV